MNKIVFGVVMMMGAAACSHGGSAAALYCSVVVAGTQECYGYTQLTPPQKKAEADGCAVLSGKVVDDCPANPIGCCKTTMAGYIVDECYYTGEASQLAATCTGTWTPGGTMTGPGVDAAMQQQSDGGMPSAQCTGSEVVCPKGCADLQNDPNNCGSCGYACPAGGSGMTPTCTAGQCGFGCTDSSTTACVAGGATYCDDLETSIYSCGACNHACPTPTAPCEKPVCQGGACGSGVPDSSQNGAGCTVPGTVVTGVCQDGSCLVPDAFCVPSLGMWEFYYYEDTMETTATSCVCSGNSLVYVANSVQNTVACAACITEASGTLECLTN